MPLLVLRDELGEGRQMQRLRLHETVLVVDATGERRVDGDGPGVAG